MIGAELRLKTIRRFAERRGHDASIGDNGIEGVASGQQLTGAGTHAPEIGEVELNELKASTIGQSVLPDLRGRRFCLRQISRRAHNLRAVRRKRTRSFDPKSGGDTGNKNPLAMQIDPRQNLIDRGSCP
jgi:hypothetical protein